MTIKGFGARIVGENKIMNLFPLDQDLTKCAQVTVDKHVVKLVTEANQLLSNSLQPNIAPYRISHYNHPMSIWVRESKANFDWTVEYCQSLLNEYTFRYGKIHKGQSVLDLIRHFQNTIAFPQNQATKMPRCFGTFKGIIPETDNVIADYRLYYKLAKSHLFRWKNRDVPKWLLT